MKKSMVQKNFPVTNPVATFIEYAGNERCVKCFFAYKRECEDAPCTSEERDDNKTGYFRKIIDTKNEIHFSKNNKPE